jgi:hypothetical protein
MFYGNVIYISPSVNSVLGCNADYFGESQTFRRKKSSGDKASFLFRPFWVRKLSDKCLPIWTLLYIYMHFNQPD